MTSLHSGGPSLPETPREESLVRAAESLDPDKSLERTVMSARFIIGGAAAVSTLLASFGGLTVEPGEKHTLLMLPALCCLAIALALAAWASVGSHGEVNIEDLEDISRFFGGEIKSRVWKVRLAGFAFAIAIPLCALPAALSTETLTRPHLDVSVSHSLLTISAYAGYQDDHHRLDITALEEGRIIAEGSWEPEEDGRLRGYLHTPVNVGKAYIQVTAALTSEGASGTHSASVSLVP